MTPTIFVLGCQTDRLVVPKICMTLPEADSGIA